MARDGNRLGKGSGRLAERSILILLNQSFPYRRRFGASGHNHDGSKNGRASQLAVSSLYSKNFATGTGTDQYCVGAPLDAGKPLTSTSPHAKLGELIGLAVKDATLEAFVGRTDWNLVYTRSIFVALGRYGLD